MPARGSFSAAMAALSVTALLAASSAWAQVANKSSPASHGDEELDVVTVTGSRIITDNVKSPTPITSVNIAKSRTPRRATRPTR